MNAPEQIFVKPGRPGAVVNQPERQNDPVPEGGCWVPNTTFWQRRLKDNDVVKATPPKSDAAPKGDAKKTS